MNMEKPTYTNDVIAEKILRKRLESLEQQALRETIVNALAAKGAESEEAFKEAYEAALLAEQTIDVVMEHGSEVSSELLAKMQETVMNPLAEKLGVSSEDLSLEKLVS